MARAESQASHDPFRAERAWEAGGEKREQTQGPGLDAIRGNPKHGEHFSQLLAEAFAATGDQGIEEMRQRFVQNAPQQGDYGKLEAYRQQYGRRLEEIKGVTDALTPAEFNQIVSSSPELVAVANAKGDWNVTRNFFVAEMENIAFNDQPRFEGIAQRMKERKDYLESESYKQQAAETRAVCDRYGVPPGRLSEITRGIDASDPNAEQLRRDAIRNAVRGQISSIGRIFDSVSGGRWTRNRVGQLETQSDVITHEVERIKGFQTEIGQALAITIDDSKEVLEAFAKTNTPEAAERTQETYISGKESGAMLKTLRNEDAYKAAWAADQALPTSERSPNRDAFTQKYINSTLEKGGKRKGLMATLVRTMTKAFADAIAL